MNHEVKRTAHRAPARQQGFTIIELMLAMTFLSVLLLAIAMSVIQIATIYNKGIVTKEINQAGRALADDIRRTAAASVKIIPATDYVTNSAGGRLCLGNFSYIWNTGRALNAGDANRTIYENGSQPIALVKVPDASKIYCSLDSSGGGFAYRYVRGVDQAQAREMLPPGDHALMINKFELLTSTIVEDESIGQTLYTLNFTLGSGRISAMNADQSACLEAGNINSDLTYCTVRAFSIVLRTGNG